jgi:ATP adenylyltransferase
MTNPLHAPWRMEYILAEKKDGPCVFCGVREASPDECRERLVLCRSERAFVMLNRYPYAAGHLIVLPYEHLGTIEDLDDDLNAALFHLVRESVKRLRQAVRCEGMNIGINQGACAGTSLREHLHVQIVPRWNGDNNFMPVIAGTRVIPQALDETLTTLTPFFVDLDV